MASRYAPAHFLELAKRLLAVEAEVINITSEAEAGPTPLGGAFLQAGQPYSNARQLRRLLAEVSGDIYWLDQHGDVHVLDVIALAATSGRHKSFTVIREGLPEEKLKRIAVDLRIELAQKGIEFQIVCIPAQQFSIHARWVVAHEGVWLLPPASALKKADEIRPSTDPAEVRNTIQQALSQGHRLFGGT